MFISMAMPNFQNIWRFSSTTGRALGVLDKLDVALTKMQMLYSLMNVVNLFHGPEWQGKYKKAQRDLGFVRAISDFDGALANFASNSGRIFLGLGAGNNNPINQFLKNNKNSLLIYGPTPEPNTSWFLPQRINVGRISLSKSHRDVKVEIGKVTDQGGRMLGIGHTQGTTRHHQQWFRQDWHKPHGAGNQRLVDPPYHYHW